MSIRIGVCLFFLIINFTHAENRIIVKLKNPNLKLNKSIFEQRPLFSELNIFTLSSKNLKLDENFLEEIRKDPNVEYAQFDHYLNKRNTPDDELYYSQWSVIPQQNLADIGATEAWQMSKGGFDRLGNEIVVAVVDSGADLEHEDLINNLWINKKEIPGNNIDDDKNGYIDDVYGWNAYENNGEIPTSSHGTHVSGIIGAQGNNQLGITGINWNIKIMNIAGSTSQTSVAIKAYNYAYNQKKLWLNSKGKQGANIVVTNSSFGIDYAKCSSGEFPVWNDLYNKMGQVGILSAAATINSNIDVDVRGDVPTECTSPYIIAVTNSNIDNEKYPDAGYGKVSIDLAAPGTDITSTLPQNGYGESSGTSMATPHVAGSVAWLYSVASENFIELSLEKPDQAALEIKRIILETVDQNPNYSSYVLSKGKLNLYNAGKLIRNY